jgi:hypothetical protein
MIVSDHSEQAMTGDDSRSVTGPDGVFHLEGVLSGHFRLIASATLPGANIEDLSMAVDISTSGKTDLGAVRVTRHRAEAPGPHATAE